jgi:hypothetical protein
MPVVKAHKAMVSELNKVAINVGDEEKKYLENQIQLGNVLSRTAETEHAILG